MLVKKGHVGAEQVREARLQTLMTKFDRNKMKEEDTFCVFVGKLSENTSKTASLGETIEETKRVRRFLKSSPKKRYIHIIRDLHIKGFEDFVGKLKTYKERNSEEEEQQDEQEKLLYAKMDTPQTHQKNYVGSKGRKREGHYNVRGKDRGQSSSYQKVLE